MVTGAEVHYKRVLLNFINVAEKISAYNIFPCRNNIALTTLHPYSMAAVSRKPDLVENTPDFNSVIKSQALLYKNI